MIFVRKHQAARDRAAALVREAAAAGRITTLDRDRRLQELEYAGTEAEIETHIRDLRQPVEPPPQAWQPPGPPAHSSVAPATAAGGRTPYAAPSLPRPRGGVDVSRQRPGSGKSNTGCLIVGAFALAFLFVLPMIAGFLTFVVSSSDSDEATGVSEMQTAEPRSQSILSRVGWRAMIAAYELQLASARISEAVIYEDWAALTMAPESGGRTYRYDRVGFTESARADRDSTQTRTFTLGEVDFGEVRASLRRAERGLGGINSRFLHIRQHATGEEPTIRATVRGDSGFRFVVMGLDGRVLDVTTQRPSVP